MRLVIVFLPEERLRTQIKALTAKFADLIKATRYP